MRTRDEFFRIMEQQTEIALATSADNVPNVRIVNFYFDLFLDADRLGWLCYFI